MTKLVVDAAMQAKLRSVCWRDEAKRMRYPSPARDAMNSPTTMPMIANIRVFQSSLIRSTLREEGRETLNTHIGRNIEILHGRVAIGAYSRETARLVPISTCGRLWHVRAILNFVSPKYLYS